MNESITRGVDIGDQKEGDCDHGRKDGVSRIELRARLPNNTAQHKAIAAIKSQAAIGIRFQSAA